ncbi:MAG: hypothetical protein EHM64_00140 [Ignavibacteriae bacterium]|nr:MAG: hypothetical protein EHM64_00140 [Ignavibacteriota bacterium]
MRKLKFKEIMIISKIFKEVEFNKYIEQLVTSDFDKILKEAGSLNSKQNIVYLNGISFIFSNMHLAETSIYELVGSYKEMNIQTVSELDGDIVINTFKELLLNGLPSIFKDLINIDMTAYKKKLKDLQK